jgi:hypothetical protein
MSKSIEHVGKTYITNEGYRIKIVEYIGNKLFNVVLDSGEYIYGLRIGSINRGEVKNPFHPSVCGVGYLGQGKYNTNYKNIYSKWMSMINRCYNVKNVNHDKSYRNASVCKEWHNFQNFAQWYEDNWKPHMEGWHLDKDILLKENKIYSPETCCFVPSEVNRSVVMNRKNTLLPLGVRKHYKKYKASISNLHIGVFNTPEEAFEAYKTAKEKYIKEIADKWKEQITEQVYNALINYKVEITD